MRGSRLTQLGDVLSRPLGLYWADLASLGIYQPLSGTSVRTRTHVTTVPRGPEATQAADCKTENVLQKQEIPDAEWK